ncbi:sensor histidine kinase [Desulfobacter sp.]
MTGPAEFVSPLYKEFIDKSSLLFFTLDQKAVIQSVNLFAKNQLGASIIGRPFDSVIIDFYNTFDLDSLLEKGDVLHPLNLKRENGLPQTYHFRFISQGPEIYALGEVDNEELEIVRKEILNLNEDLSNLTRELHKKNAQLKALNQEKNKFLGMAAHDLRKPIGLILAYSDFLIDEALDTLSDEHLGFLHTIQKSCTFMKRIVDDFLDVSAIEAGRFELDPSPARFESILEQALRLNMLQAAKKGIALDVKADTPLPRMFIDPAKIEQVITNLVSNAIEHTQPGTKVEVRLSHFDSQVEFSVKDQGSGIPEDELDRIFKPFEKTSVKKTGGEKSTGLGMVIARKIIEAHKGKIWVESAVNKGTHIHFSLPISGTGHERSKQEGR